jgi:hypothetical protein
MLARRLRGMNRTLTHLQSLTDLLLQGSVGMSQILTLLLKLSDLALLHIAIPCKHNIVRTKSDLLADRCTASNIWANIASMPKGAGGDT